LSAIKHSLVLLSLQPATGHKMPNSRELLQSFFHLWLVWPQPRAAPQLSPRRDEWAGAQPCPKQLPVPPSLAMLWWRDDGNGAKLIAPPCWPQRGTIAWGTAMARREVGRDTAQPQPWVQTAELPGQPWERTPTEPKLVPNTTV